MTAAIAIRLAIAAMLLSGTAAPPKVSATPPFSLRCTYSANSTIVHDGDISQKAEEDGQRYIGLSGGKLVVVRGDGSWNYPDYRPLVINAASIHGIDHIYNLEQLGDRRYAVYSEGTLDIDRRSGAYTLVVRELALDPNGAESKSVVPGLKRGLIMLAPLRPDPASLLPGFGQVYTRHGQCTRVAALPANTATNTTVMVGNIDISGMFPNVSTDPNEP